jgi:predicted MFS family arabinose efflux permease
VPSRRWLGVLSLMTILAVAYMDRINVSLLITDADFLHAFGLAGNRGGQGQLMTLFLVGYGLSAWFVTPLFEARLGVRGGLIASLALWSVLTGLSAVTAGIAAFLVWRFLLGMAEGPLFSLKTMFVRDNFSPREVGKPNAVSSLGVSIGLGAGYPVLSFLIFHFGWRGSFWALAAINLVVGLPLALAFIGRRKAAPGRKAPAQPAGQLFRAALATPGLLPILLAEICTLSYLWGASTWLPSYLSQARHFSLAAMSVFAGLPFIVGILANVAAGSLLDLMPARAAPWLFVAGGVATAAAVTVAVLADNPYVAAIALVAAGAAWAFQSPAIPTLIQHVAAPGAVGSAYGLINGVGNLVAALMPMMMGAAMATSRGVNFAHGFWLLVGSQLMTVLAGFWLLRSPGVARAAAGTIPSLP